MAGKLGDRLRQFIAQADPAGEASSCRFGYCSDHFFRNVFNMLHMRSMSFQRSFKPTGFNHIDRFPDFSFGQDGIFLGFDKFDISSGIGDIGRHRGFKCGIADKYNHRKNFSR
jgi:hypothetical protein